MKFTNKWIVVPYSSIDKKLMKKRNVTNQILGNKSLSKEEKLASYNNYIIRKLRKKKLNPSKTQTESDLNKIENYEDDSQD